MKKVIFLMACCILSFTQIMNAQICAGVTAVAFPLNPQAENFSYYGVRVGLEHSYTQDVTVVGGIRANDGEPAFLWSLTIPAGSLTAETPATYFRTTYGSEVTVDIQSVDPCPPEFEEEIIGAYSTLNSSYTIDLNPQNQDLINELSDMFSLQNATIDSMMIDDDSPILIDSASYLVFYVTATNAKFAFGLHLKKELGTNQIIYKLNNSSYSVSRAWSCKKNSSCTSCVPHRNWFAGPVKDCDCGNGGQTDDCIFETSGSGFPWAPVLGLIGVILGILAA